MHLEVTPEQSHEGPFNKTQRSMMRPLVILITSYFIIWLYLVRVHIILSYFVIFCYILSYFVIFCHIFVILRHISSYFIILCHIPTHFIIFSHIKKNRLPTNGLMDQWIDTPCFRDVRMHLKMYFYPFFLQFLKRPSYLCSVITLERIKIESCS